MAIDAQPVADARKKPRQARSRATVSVILQAAAQILESRGEEAVTTKNVAERAGCSIGTLYQYFSDRDEILVALVDRERERIGKRFDALAEKKKVLGSDASAREFIHALVRSFAGRRGAKRQFELMAALHGKRPVPLLYERFAETFEQRWAKSAPNLSQEARAARAFVMTRAIVGVLRAAAIEDSPLLGTAAFEDALLLVVKAFEIIRDNAA